MAIPGKFQPWAVEVAASLSTRTCFIFFAPFLSTHGQPLFVPIANGSTIELPPRQDRPVPHGPIGLVHFPFLGVGIIFSSFWSGHTPFMEHRPLGIVSS